MPFGLLKNTMAYDIIICGAGTAGCIAAYFASKKGLNTFLIETKPKSSIGNKICGDAVGCDIFSFLNIPIPPEQVVLRKIEGGNLYSPSGAKIPLKDPKQAGFIVDRKAFGQWLLSRALEQNSLTFSENTAVISPIQKENRIVGLSCRNKTTKQELDYYAPIIVDCTGYSSPIRQSISAPENEPKFDQTRDSILCYREICRIKDPNFSHGADSRMIGIYLDPKKAPGGYIWYFPRTDDSVNIGLGVYPHMKRFLKEYFERHVKLRFLGRYSNIEVISSGGGIVSVRRPLFSSVNDDVMFAGDAGLHVNPIHGGGIDSSMRAGFYAAQTAAECHELGRYDKRALWPYNLKIIKEFGKSFASLHVIRLALQKFSSEAIDFGIKNRFLNAEEILHITAKGDIPLNPLTAIQKSMMGLLQPKFLLDFAYVYSQIGKVARHFDNYPQQPELLNGWMKMTKGIFDRIQSTII
jgi:digeranylgeranylglycerophospholipid reductase